MQPEVAIIVPVYNTGKGKLKACINSILNQTFKEFILVLVDDGSTDCSGAVCDEYAKKDPRITIIHQKNSGSLQARKNGVFFETAQQSKYICMCDSDDTMPRDAIEKLYRMAEYYHADCVCGESKKNIWKSVYNITTSRDVQGAVL